LLANRTVSGFDENEVKEEEDEGFCSGIPVKNGSVKSGGWVAGLGVGGSMVIPSYIKSEESSFESGSGVTP
jgi:hypothetical protein